MRFPPRSRKALALVFALSTAALLLILWFARWRLGHTAVMLAEPRVRSWAASQVRKASNNAYHIVIGKIDVDEEHQRLSIDSITLTTDEAINNRLARPHPVATVRFHRCSISGIDLIALAGGGGLHALHAGCDSVALGMRTIVAESAPVERAVADPDSNNFLRFQGKLDLPGGLPQVTLDSVTFPHVRASFDLLSTDGRRTSVSVDSLGVSLDSMRIDPKEKVAQRRPLFSRNVRVTLDHFAGRTKAGADVSLEHLAANLDNGTARLDAVVYDRRAGEKIDSTGSMLLRAKHVMLDGVRWRTFLLTGDVSISSLQVDSALIDAVQARNPQRSVAQAATGSIEDALRSAERAIAIELIDVHSLRMTEAGRRIASPIATNLRQLTIAHLDVVPADSSWQKPFPIGRVVVTATGMTRRTGKMDIALGHLVLDAAAKTLTLDSLRAAPPGGDSAFALRNKFRTSRISITVPHLEAQSIDLPAFLTRGALRAQTLTVNGLALDVMNDKHTPENPAPDKARRSPQGVIRDANMEIQIDTIVASGVVTYRERDESAAKPGVLSFKSLQLRGYNFSTDPDLMTPQNPFRLVGDAKLMGDGVMHVQWDVPLLSSDYAMTWKGSLGGMDPRSMNAFLPDAVGMKFIGGAFLGAEWNAVVRGGKASGTISPTWHGLKVELPGVARNNSSVFGGLLRGVAKLATNTFGIRGDNEGPTAITARIDHQWVNTETLPAFIWSQLRDPLLTILKK